MTPLFDLSGKVASVTGFTLAPGLAIACCVPLPATLPVSARKD